jgi:hypothetical protein
MLVSFVSSAIKEGNSIIKVFREAGTQSRCGLNLEIKKDLWKDQVQGDFNGTSRSTRRGG